MQRAVALRAPRAPTAARPTSDAIAPQGWTERCAVLMALALGLGVRVLVLRSPLGQLNSDEATVGLMAERILGGDVPLVVAGNNYGGTLEAFLAAPVLAATGPSSQVLKALPVLLWLLAAVLVHLVAAPLVGRRLGLVLGAVLWVFSSSMVLLSTLCYPGYSSGVAGCLLAVLLLQRELSPGADTGRAVSRRLLLGFATGITLWLHPLHLALLVPVHAVHGAHRWRSARTWLPPVVLGGALGLLPMLLHVLGRGSSGLAITPQVATTYPERLLGFGRELLPRLIGLQSQGGSWTGGWLGRVLFLAALVLFGLAVLTLLRGGPAEQLVAWAALVSPLLTAAFSTSWYYDDARYGVAYSAVVVLVAGLAVRRLLAGRRVPWPALFAVPLLWFALLCLPHLGGVPAPAGGGGADADAERLAAQLHSAGVTHVRADYWIAYRLAFLSEGLVVTPFTDVRFPDDDADVLAAGSGAALVVFAGEQRDVELRQTAADRDRRMVDGFAVYLPPEAD